MATPPAEVTIHPWEFQDGENAMWYSRFRRYYLLAGPDRSLRGAYNAFLDAGGGKGAKRKKAPKGGKKRRSKNPPAAWSNNAKKGKWKERAEAFDRHEERNDIETYRAEQAAFRKRQIAIGKQLQGIGLNALKKAKDDADNPIPPGEGRRLVVDGLKAEQAGLGIPTHLVELFEMTPEEKRKRIASLGIVEEDEDEDDADD